MLLGCPKLTAWLGRMEDHANLKGYLALRGHAIAAIVDSVM